MPRVISLACWAVFCAASARAYSFVSCTNFDRSSQTCYGYPRKYIQWVGTMSHAYDLASDLPDSTNQQYVSVDTLLQNRSVDGTAFAAYEGGYPMGQAVPGQRLTLTWPRTAVPDGDPATSPSALVYYWANSSINTASEFNTSTDPSLAEFQENELANLPFNENGTCQVIDDSQKYNPAAHCQGQIVVPQNLGTGIYTFLWYWVINQPTLYRIYPMAFEILVQNVTSSSLVSSTGSAYSKVAP